MDTIAQGYGAFFTYSHYEILNNPPGFIVFFNCVFKIDLTLSKSEGYIVRPGTFIPQITVKVNMVLEQADGGEIGNFNTDAM